MKTLIRTTKKRGAVMIKILIPVRMGSTRFPGKCFKKIKGKTILQRVYETCRNYYLNTEVIADFPWCQASYINKSDFSNINNECCTGTDRVRMYIESSNGYNDSDTIIIVQADEPMIKIEDVQKIYYAKLANPDSIFGMCCGFFAEEDNVHTPKVILRNHNDISDLIYISRTIKPTIQMCYKQIGVYAYTVRQLIDIYDNNERGLLESIEDVELLRCIDKGYDVKMIYTSNSYQAVDVPSDIQKVERLMKNG